MILDRDLSLDLLDIAFRIGVGDSEFADKRKLLTVALRDHVSDQEAKGKTKKCLTRVWVNPPADATEMVAWGRDHAQLAADRRALHLGALLATFPFVGGVAAIVGRALALDGHAEPPEVRRRVRALWGDRSSIDVGARKAYTTLAKLGVLSGGGRAPYARGEVLETEGEIAGWIIHALLLTRGTSSVSDAELGSAPELFWTKLGRPDGSYPLLKRHNEGGRRVVWAVS